MLHPALNLSTGGINIDTLIAGPPTHSTVHHIDDLKLLPVWADPKHLVLTARHIMEGHNIRALSVVQDGAVLGCVTLARLVDAPDMDPIEGYVEPAGPLVQAGTPVRKVAELFVREHVDHAAVVQGERFVGMVTSNLLLRELGRSWDPLTHLPWSDRLREWGVESLKQGKEICIIFVDLNDFGHYNKRYGHIVGDHVLGRVARLLKDSLDMRTDVLVRYGGDEFAIGTTRTLEEAELLMDALKARMPEASIPEASEPVTFSLGLRGGKRTKERESVHFAATLDNLINLASQECLAQKPKAKTVDTMPLPSEPATVPEPRPEVVGVYTDERSANALTTVFLKVGTTVVSGMHHRAGKTPLESVAVATGKALERVFTDSVFEVDGVVATGDGESRMVTVTGQLTMGEDKSATAGTHLANGDALSAAAEATIEAVASGRTASGISPASVGV